MQPQKAANSSSNHLATTQKAVAVYKDPVVAELRQSLTFFDADPPQKILRIRPLQQSVSKITNRRIPFLLITKLAQVTMNQASTARSPSVCEYLAGKLNRFGPAATPRRTATLSRLLRPA